MIFAKSKKYQKKIFIILLCLILTAAFSYIQYLLGSGLIISLFFIFPIILSTWKTGIWSGIVFSFVSSIILMIITGKNLQNLISIDFISYLNNLFRLIIFLIITYIISELKSSLEKQKELARIDPLTSIPNSRAFYETAILEFEKAKRHRFPISIIYMDLDNFKKVNDTLGHSTGDRLLNLVALTIINNIRNIDIVARLGGDEFGILLSQTGAESAFIVGTKLREMLLDTMQKNRWPVTSSIGIVTFLKAPESIDEMMKKADALMYAAKNSGKNIIKQNIIS
jgi:diguanylate cyclase (GGDEF)-like protein